MKLLKNNIIATTAGVHHATINSMKEGKSKPETRAKVKEALDYLDRVYHSEREQILRSLKI